MTASPVRPDDRRHRRLEAGVFLALHLLSGSALRAQELPFQGDSPDSGRASCPAGAEPAAPSAEARAQAIELTSSSDQSLILGDLPRAAALLERATELNPASPELAYQRARVLERMEEPVSAAAEYCRAIFLSPDGIRDATLRLEALQQERRTAPPAEATAALESGLASASRGAMSDALTSFRLAIARAPDWAIAHYNLGVALVWEGREYEGALALQRYLELRPGAPDALAVSRRVGQLEGLAAVTGPSPIVAASLGAVVPGAGQFYAGRPVVGLAVLSLAGGAVAAGLFVTEVDVRCLTPGPPGEPCPQGEVVSRDTSRPYLILGAGTAAAVGLIGALEAFLEARRRRTVARSGFVRAEARNPTLERPTVTVKSGRVELTLVGLRFH